MIKKSIKVVKNSIQKAVTKSHEVALNERGDLGAMMWVIGSAVVVVLVVVVFMTLAPQTAQNIWNSFVAYAQGKYGF